MVGARLARDKVMQMPLYPLIAKIAAQIAAAALLLAAAGASASTITPLPRLQYDRQFFDLSHQRDLCTLDPANVAAYIDCSLTQSGQYWSRDITEHRHVQAQAFDPARGTLQSVVIRWDSAGTFGGFPVPAGALVRANANFGFWRNIQGYIDSRIIQRATITNPAGGDYIAPWYYGPIVSDSCQPDVNRGGYTTTYDNECFTQMAGLAVLQGETILDVNDTSVAGQYFAVQGGGILDLSFELTTSFTFASLSGRTDVPLYTNARSGSVNLRGGLELVYGYTPATTPRGNPPGSPPPPGTPPAAVPLPPALAMMTAGLAGALCWSRSKRPARGGAIRPQHPPPRKAITQIGA